MSDGALSQKEIDALLGGGLPSEFEDTGNFDAIGDILTEFVKPWILTLLERLQSTGTVQPAEVSVDHFETLGQQIGQALFVEVELDGSIPGAIFVLVSNDVVQRIGTSLLEEQTSDVDLDEAYFKSFSSVLDDAREGMESALSSSLNAAVNVRFSTPPMRVDFSTGEANNNSLPIGEEVIQTKINVESESFNFELWAQIPTSLAAGMISLLPEGVSDRVDPAFSNPPASEPQEEDRPRIQPMDSTSDAPRPAGKASVQAAHFGELGQVSTKEEHSNLNFLLDVPLQVTVELGRTRMQIREVLDLGKGSVIELEKLAGEPVEVFINGKLIAKGEVVTIDENFGVKITDIVSQAERVHNLQ